MSSLLDAERMIKMTLCRTVLLAALMAVGCDGLFADLEELDQGDAGHFDIQEDDVEGLDADVAGPLGLVTVDVDQISVTSATFYGAFDDPPTGDIEEFGFCWGVQPQPAHTQGECHVVDEVDDQTTFRHTVQELSAGREYFVRAFATPRGEASDFANELSFSTHAPSVEQVDVVAGNEPGTLEIHWDTVAGATEYRLLRDGEELVVVEAEGADAMSHVDDDLHIDISPPANVSASFDEQEQFVELSWQAVTLGEGQNTVVHHYSVVALYPDVQADPAEEVEGSLDATEVTHYEFQLDGGQWEEFDEGELIVEGDIFSYEDHELAEEVSFEPGEPSVSQGEYFRSIRVELPDLEFAAQPTEYRIRAVTDAGAGEHSGPATAARRVGELQVQWQRSEGPEDGDYVVVPQGFFEGMVDEIEEFVDTDVPLDGEVRYYRAHVDAVEYVDVEFQQTTEALSGYVAVANIYASARDGTTRKFDSQLQEQWSVEYGGLGLGVGVNPWGYLYSATANISALRRVDNETGDLLWTADEDIPSWVVAVAVDRDGNAIVSTGGGEDAVLRKYDPDGNELWTYTGHDDNVREVAIDGAGYIYASSDDGTVHKLEDLGDDVENVWISDDHGTWVRAMAVSPDGIVFTGTRSGTSGSLYMLDENGQIEDEFNLGSYTYGLALSRDGYLYSASADNNLRRLDVSDGLSATGLYAHEATVRGVAVDPHGYVYTVTNGSDDELGMIRKFDATLGDPIIEEPWPIPLDDPLWPSTSARSIFGVATDPGPYGAFADVWNDEVDEGDENDDNDDNDDNDE